MTKDEENGQQEKNEKNEKKSPITTSDEVSTLEERYHVRGTEVIGLLRIYFSLKKISIIVVVINITIIIIGIFITINNTIIKININIFGMTIRPSSLPSSA
ncbi:hypothetical protein PV08_05837 [Exophiala spinifera]|uniref:Uncharacterized protein n=1 Tax=Exophiala spinifera TaxID=91928 RepID=A0A0D1ZSH9_9EURO|nr:uncharacterized protein PV08_05837 [Exophiala spinifera]KIW15787.1 hypothetical protein PV08_05837 [Exophiala spinifera]